MDRRMIALGVLAAGIALAVIGGLGHGWFAHTERNVELNVGLRTIEVCGMGQCQAVKVSDLPVDDLFSMAGNVAFFTALLGAGLGVVAGLLTISRTRLTIPVSPARLSIAFFGAAALGGVIFVATRPDELAGASMGMSAFLGIGGSALGAAGAFLVYRHEQLTAREELAREQTFA